MINSIDQKVSRLYPISYARIEKDPTSKDHVLIIDCETKEVISRTLARNGKPIKGISVNDRPSLRVIA